MTHKFLPPEAVNYNNSFRFVHYQEQDGTVFEWSPEQETVYYNDKKDSARYSRSSAIGFVEGKNWLVIDESTEQPLAKSFQFEIKYGTTSCTYTQQPSGNPVISWATNSTDRYSEEDCRGKFESGEWNVLPSSPAKDAAEQAFEDAFTAVQGIVKSAKKLTMENGSKVVFSTCEDESSDNLLGSIKTFTREVNATVFIVDGTYEIYTQEQVCRASGDEQMKNLMGAIRIVEKSLVDDV